MEKQDTAIDSPDTKLAQDSAQTHSGTVSSTFTNGLSNGASDSQTTISFSNTSQKEQGATNGDVASTERSQQNGVLPPLDRSWRDTEANKSFGKLLNRMAQMCYSDLSETVTKMDEIAVDEGPHVNGFGTGSVDDMDPESLKKKRMIMDYASMWRERFVKARVISDWARNSGEDVAKVIDLRSTMMARNIDIENAIKAVADIKRDTIDARQPAPNLSGAMQYLSGRKSTYTDLGYIKQAPLSARQILDLLNDMAVVANQRIWLHENELPYHMSEYDVGNGRVTFKTPGEFELDLACLDEDPEKSPWYFIDFRFDFSPAPKTFGVQTRSHLETQINAAATSRGLQGCYDFCHNFVLDYKIIEVESQAYDLLRKQWFESVKIQRMRRNIIIEYWISATGKRSWIELGILSGKNGGTTYRPSAPKLALTWHMAGELMPADDIKIEDRTVNVEDILLQVVRKHTSMRLRQLATEFQARASQSGILQVAYEESTAKDETDAIVISSCGVEHATGTVLRISFGSYTGKWILQPVTPFARVAKALDEVSDSAAFLPLELQVCSVLQETAHHCAELRSWRKLNDLRNMTQRQFKEQFAEFVVLSFWKPDACWNDTWAIALSTTSKHHSWWVARLCPVNEGRTVAEAKQLDVEAASWQEQLGRAEILGVAQVQYMVLSAQLRTSKISFHNDIVVTGSRLTKKPVKSMVWFISIPDTMRQSRSIDKDLKWPLNLLRLSSGGVVNGLTSVRHYLRMTVNVGTFKHLQRCISANNDSSIAINDTNGVALWIDVAFGEPFLQQIQSAITRVYQLERTCAVIRSLRLKCERLDLRAVSITYDARGFSARLNYNKDGSANLRLEPAASNPHHRIRLLLERLLHHDNEHAFDKFAHTLLFTLPVMIAADKLEIMPGLSCSLRARQVAWYTFRYSTSPPITFTLRGRSRTIGSKTSLKWHLEQERQRPGLPSQPETLLNALREFWSKPGPGCQALGTGLAADPRSIATALEQLDSLVRKHVEVDVSTAAAAVNGQSQPGNAVKDSVKVEQKERPDVIMLD